MRRPGWLAAAGAAAAHLAAAAPASSAATQRPRNLASKCGEDRGPGEHSLRYSLLPYRRSSSTALTRAPATSCGTDIVILSRARGDMGAGIITRHYGRSVPPDHQVSVGFIAHGGRVSRITHVRGTRNSITRSRRLCVLEGSSRGGIGGGNGDADGEVDEGGSDGRSDSREGVVLGGAVAEVRL
jgi:hypothetical protein